MTQLRDLEEWLVGAIVAPELASADDVARLVTPGPKLDPRGRLGVYHSAYVARLIECIADDYPVCAWALGEDEWNRVARGYVAARPSSHPSLNAYGAELRDHLRAHAPPFIADLGRLEWAIVEAIHADAGETLGAEALAALPPDAWGTARLVTSPSLSVIRSDYPINAFFQAFKDELAPAWPEPEATATAVYRHGGLVYRMRLTLPMAALLEALRAGQPLGAALESLERSLAPDDLTVVATHLSDWFSSWTASGIFARLEEG